MSKMAVILNSLTGLARHWKGFFYGAWRASNVKVVAYELARQKMEREVLARQPVPKPAGHQLQSIICQAVDWRSDWLPYWAGRYGMQPALHRKLWELAYIPQVLHENGKLVEGSTGIGFGCGKEPLASILAVEGCHVLATDLQASDPRAQAWSHGEQHGGGWADVWSPLLCPEEVARERISFRSVDMNSIPAETHGKYDFCWSTCALEHLGSIANGLRFIVESTKCLKVGGIAVHTTEISLEPGRYLDNYPTVVFQMEDFHRLEQMLLEEGVELLPIVHREGIPFLDEYVDVPPYTAARSAIVGSTLAMLHLRVLVASYVTTSIGLIARRVRT